MVAKKERARALRKKILVGTVTNPDIGKMIADPAREEEGAEADHHPEEAEVDPEKEEAEA